MTTILFDNEPVQALLNPAHPKHRTVTAHIAGIVSRRKKGARIKTVVPTAVRVEAGWDRADARTANINRFRLLDAPLDKEAANLAATIARQIQVSVADAHIGAVARTTDDHVVALTSDPQDIRAASDPKPITVVRI